MLQSRRGLDLPEEPLGAEAEGQLGQENLEGDRPVVPHIVREIDDGHAPAPELTLDHVVVAKGLSEVGWDLGNGTPSGWFSPEFRPGRTNRQTDAGAARG
jgi:hypothetical protein